MALLGINFDDVPDKIEPIQPGVYDLEILEATVEDVENKPGKQKVVVKHKITTEGVKDSGRETTNHISTEMKTTLKNLYHSATGERPGANGFDPVDLVGKTVKARIELNSWKDKASGETRTNSRVAEYMIPAGS